MKKVDLMKKVIVLLSPFLLFAVLYIPYEWFNGAYLVDWFGCGCPVMDEYGNYLTPPINANTITTYFWLGVAIVVCLISFFVSKKVFVRCPYWMRAAYISAVLLASVWIAYCFRQSMMWN